MTLTRTTVYVMGADGILHAPGMPDLHPGGGPVDPPPPPPNNPLLRFDTTLFGQSYARYESPTLGSSSSRYDAVERDTYATIDGVLRRGSAVIRVYNDGQNGPGTWADAHPAYIRPGQPVIYSWKWPAAVTETTCKAQFRTFLDSKPTTSEFAWLVAWHEPDDNIVDGDLTMTQWLNHNAWCREVLDETAYTGRSGDDGDLRFGMITTGTLWNKSTQPDAARGWRTYYNAAVARRGDTDMWDFMGGDRYNPAWDGPNRYVTPDNWILRKQQMYDEVGLPFVLGECGSARATTTNGLTLAQRETERANWWRSICDRILLGGFFDACCWWRVPNLTGFSTPFSTIMITPTGYNAQYTAAGVTGPPDGTDAQAVVDAHSEYCLSSMAVAGIPFWTP